MLDYKTLKNERQKLEAELMENINKLDNTKGGEQAFLQAFLKDLSESNKRLNHTILMTKMALTVKGHCDETC